MALEHWQMEKIRNIAIGNNPIVGTFPGMAQNVE